MNRIGVVVSVVAIAGGLEATAFAQVCTQSTSDPGIAQVSTGGATVKISMPATGIPKVNGVSCGFPAGAIEVFGVAGKDVVILNYVPPWIPVSMALDAGTNNVTIYETNSGDRVVCGAASVDRDDDGTDDVHFGATALNLVTLNLRGGDDVVDCRAAGYKLNIKGSTGNDTIFGGALNDTIDGGDGADIIEGHGGNDRLGGNTGNDELFGQDGNDTFTTMSTFDGNDVFDGGAGSDTVSYAGRTTTVVGGVGGEDVISDDLETIRGGKGDDQFDYSLVSMPHYLRGGAGNDTLIGGPAADKLYGEAGNDFVVGNGARDPVIDGGDGDDSLGFSLDGFAETVKCGAGTDSYIGNTEDTFVGCETQGSAGAIEKIAMGVAHTCALLTTGAVKCWGYNGHGALGHGSVVRAGAEPGTMGAALPATDLGTGRTAIAITAGWEHTCALLDNHTVKCWGWNGEGELGYGDTVIRGDEPGEMGDALPAVPLGTGRTALAISSGGLHTCAILDDLSLKCWGYNAFGQLGLGDTTHHGDGPAEMGDSLPAIDLGTGRTAASVDAGYYHTCVVLDDATVKCWGIGSFGELGVGDTSTRGDEPGEMGDALPVVALGTGRSALEVSVAHLSTCAILDNRTVKCWGYGGYGQLGDGDVQNRGDQAGEMGNALPTVPLGRSTVTMSSGLDRHCAILDNGTAKCWGWNAYGSLGQGDLEDRGDQPGELATMPAIAIGTGRTIVGLTTTDGYHACAKLDDATLKCWGLGDAGQLGLEDTLTRGDEPGEMGDALPAVDIGGLVGFAPEPAPAGDTAMDAVDLIDDASEESDAAEIDDGDGDGDDDEDDSDDVLDDTDATTAGGCSTSRGGGSLALCVLLAVAFAGSRRTSRQRLA